ncbi:hypothetical protein QFN52_004301 [Escherichia coli]|nr:hypothetical protein [Escherichia coli]EKY6658092.1 hypothetical protein [Escherichia coli]
MLSGCVTQQAPVFILLGSYFPSWIACALLGIVAAVIVRLIFIWFGIDEALTGRLFVYTCLALTVAFMSSFLIFSR